MDAQKRCYVCERTLPATVEFFSRNKRRPDGLTILCKLCAAEKYRAYYEKNKEKLIAAAVKSTKRRRERPEVREADRTRSREAKRRELADPKQREVLYQRNRDWMAAHPGYQKERSRRRRKAAANARPQTHPGQCSQCNEIKPQTAEFFYFRPNGTQFGRQCKECHAKNAAAYRAANPGVKAAKEKVRLTDPAERAKKAAANAASYQKHREARLAACKEYRAKPGVRERKTETERARLSDPATSAKVKAYLQEYHVNRMMAPAQRERVRHYGRQYAKLNPEKMKAHTRNRRARIREAEGTHGSQDVSALLIAQDFRCYWCSSDISEGKHTVDHYHPLAKGGSNWPSNLVMACATCNYTKRDKLPDEFRSYLAKRQAAKL